MRLTSCPPVLRVLLLLLLLLLVLVLVLVLLRRRDTRPTEERFAGGGHRERAPRTTTVVGIAGNPCAGKSTLAKNLQHRLQRRGFRVITLSQDSISVLSHVGISKGAAFLCRRFADKIARTIDAGEHDVMIVEGYTCLGSCGGDALTNRMHARIYLRYNTDNCRRNGRRSWYNPKIFFKPFIVTHTPPKNATQYDVDGIDPRALADRVLHDILLVHQRRMGTRPLLD